MSGFSFGTPTTNALNTSLPTFGSTQTPASNNQFTLGNNATPSGGFSFGSQPKQVITMTSAPLTNTPSAPKNTSFSFGASTPFVANTTTSSIASTSVAPLGITSNTVTVQPNLFGTTATSTVQPNLFGTTTTSTVQPNLFGTTATSTGQSNLFGTTATSTGQSNLFGTTATTSSTAAISNNNNTQSVLPTSNAFIGLGGIDMSSTQQKAPEGKMEAAKETYVPCQIVQTIEEFKTYVKNQKTISSEITRLSDRKLKTVTDEIQRMNCGLQEASNNIDNNRSAIRHLRNETAKVIENADMAQRTHETPQGLQFENVMPQIYFRDLIQKYETDLLNLKQQVELTEKHLQSLANPQNFTAQDLKRGLHQIYESFITLAGRLQDAHSKVETQKTQYLALRKSILRDSTNVFECNESASSSKDSRVQYGPNIFSQDSSQPAFVNISFQKASQQHQQLAPNNFFTQPTPSFNFGQK